ncbi:MAG: hypothetical protein B7Y46_16635 [Acidovorax sp. 28-64-14]|uniref:hypothetical protein n=1 Tax=Acidovorax sp. 28-64-14 TaxID=1970310 RepID=UPI000BC408E0|nr:hypothetical protein [Acidovorax sp. 28-64-14]OYY83018.1 MAG: hypothetical protein B7Y46_16635 [Acidovorax sp. 28-64-14]
MAEIGFSGGDKLEKYLADALASAESAKQLSVGFMSGATYPDGTKVAYVAAINNYGAPGRNIPPRPFFSGMVEQKSPGWGARLGEALKFTDFNGKKALSLMGEEIVGDLKQSITDMDSPPLSPATIARKGFAKPLIDTSHMINSAQYAVDDDEPA